MGRKLGLGCWDKPTRTEYVEDILFGDDMKATSPRDMWHRLDLILSNTSDRDLLYQMIGAEAN